jgi:hypothetical protein
VGRLDGGSPHGHVQRLLVESWREGGLLIELSLVLVGVPLSELSLVLCLLLVVTVHPSSYLGG